MELKPLLVKARLGEIKGKRMLSKKEERELVKAGCLRKKGRKFVLTEKGRKKVKVVMTGGAFDLLHLGHVYTLEKARKAGDVLVVAVAHDRTVRRGKGRQPLHNARERAELLGKLKCVDVAIVGHPRDRKVTLRKVRPDVVVFGYDQKADKRLRARVKRLKARKKGRKFKTSGMIEDL